MTRSRRRQSDFGRIRHRRGRSRCRPRHL